MGVFFCRATLGNTRTTDLSLSGSRLPGLRAPVLGETDDERPLFEAGFGLVGLDRSRKPQGLDEGLETPGADLPPLPLLAADLAADGDHLFGDVDLDVVPVEP